MEKVEIKKLIEQCLNYFYESGYAKALLTITSVCGQKAFYSTCRTKGLICIHLM